jgi:hypothetical protein
MCWSGSVSFRLRFLDLVVEYIVTLNSMGPSNLGDAISFSSLSWVAEGDSEMGVVLCLLRGVESLLVALVSSPPMDLARPIASLEDLLEDLGTRNCLLVIKKWLRCWLRLWEVGKQKFGVALARRKARFNSTRVAAPAHHVPSTVVTKADLVIDWVSRFISFMKRSSNSVSKPSRLNSSELLFTKQLNA